MSLPKTMLLPEIEALIEMRSLVLEEKPITLQSAIRTGCALRNRLSAGSGNAPRLAENICRLTRVIQLSAMTY